MKNKLLIIFLFLLLIFPVASADLFSINSGGFDSLIINPGGWIESFFLNANRFPVVSDVVLNSSLGTNTTDENLTIYYSSTDADGNAITNITDWRKDSDSIAVLNMAFDKRIHAGEVRDYSTYENHGTLGGGTSSYAPTWVLNGQVGGAYEFDGVDDYVDCGNSESIFPANTYSWNFWTIVNSAGAGTHRYFWVKRWHAVNKEGDILFIRSTTGKLEWHLGNGTTTAGVYSNNVLPTDVWMHIVGTYDGTTMKMYVNSVLQNNQGTLAGPITYPGTSNFLIGKATSSINGSIDEVKIYNHTLSPEQINASYQAGLAGHQIETIVSNETSKGETWQVAVTPNDVFDDGITVLSNTLTIDNAIPVVSDVVLNSTYGTNRSYENLTVYYSSSDSDECYDNETEILSSNGWKYFKDLNNKDQVATLNQETGELEWQLPTEKQVFDYDGEMFRIETEKGDLLVSPKHQVYSSSRNSLSSLVVNTSTTDCSLKCESSDQTGMLSLSDNARYGESFGSDINLFAQFNCCGEILTFKLTNLDNISFIFSNLSSEIFNLEQSNSEYLLSSSKRKGCEYNFSECLLANCLVNESFFNSENATLVSTTNFIYGFPNLFQIFSLTSSPNFKQSSSVNLLSFVNSSSSLNNSALSSWARTSCLASSDQFTQDNCFISNFTFSGTANVTDGIYNSPIAFNLFNCSTLRIIMFLNTSDHLISGCLSNFSFSSFVIDNVTVAIFDLPLNYVYTQECVDTYKSSYLKDFSLNPITNVYSNYLDKKEIYFLDSENKLIKILSIEKEDCEMFKIKLKDGSELLVSPRHKVYVAEKESHILSNFLKSLVLNISTGDCFLNLGSLDQIAQFNFNASANIGMSLSCISCLACDSNFLYSFSEINETCLANFLNTKNISSGFNPEYFDNLEILFLNSSIVYSGENNSNECNSDFKMACLTGFSLKNEKSILVSNTSFIFYQPCSLCLSQTRSLSSSPSLSACFSVNLDLDKILSTIENSNSFANDLIDSVSADSNLSLNSAGISTLMFISCMNEINNKEYLNLSIEDFSLNPITNVYSDYLDKKEIYFLDSENKLIKVQSIEKVPYSGKIYDVDVENDIVLVRRTKENKLSINKKNKDATNVASKVKQICQDYNNFNGNNYLDVSEKNKEEKKSLNQVETIRPDYNLHNGIKYINVSAGCNSNKKYEYRLDAKSSRVINATVNHSYLAKSFVNEGYVLNAKGEIINNLSLNSDDLTFSNNFNKSEKVVSIKGGMIFNTTIPKCSLGGNSFLLRKCLSNVNITRNSDLAILDNCLSVEPKGAFLTSCPCFINNSVTCFGKFSSERNFNLFLEENMFFFSDEFRSISHNREDSGLCERWKIILKDFIDTDPCSEQFQNLPNHNSCSFKGRSSATNFTVNNNVVINFNSHDVNKEKEYLKLSEIKVDDEVVNNKKNKDATNVASKVKQICQDYNNFNGNNYLDVSVNDSKKYLKINGKLIDVTGAVWSGNSDAITNITDWRVNESSIAVLNLPFDTEITSTASGAVRDYSTFGNNGTLGGGTSGYKPTWTSSGKVGGAYEFDGVDDYVDCGNSESLNITNAITIESWIKLNNVESTAKTITGKAWTYYWLYTHTAHATFYLRTGPSANYTSLSSSEVLGTTNWHHIVGTYDGSTNEMYLYVDGVQYGPKEGAGLINSHASSFKIGNYGSGSPFNGSIDEVKIYNHSLSPEQINASYQAGLAGHQIETIMSQETSAGQTWEVAVTPNDVYSDGTTVLSNNLTVIDLESPNITIISPNSSFNYTTLEIDFNISISDDGTIDWCGYSLNNDSNITMTEFNNTYWWFEPSDLSPGTHNLTFYCNDTSGNYGTNSTNFTILDEAAISIYLSPFLSWNVNWSLTSLPADDLGALGNNEDNATFYYINISVTNTYVDLYVRADGDLLTEAEDRIGLGNETYFVNYTDSTVPSINKLNMTTDYYLIGDDMDDGSVIYLKFYLDAPSSQPAGMYLNNLEFKAVSNSTGL